MRPGRLCQRSWFNFYIQYLMSKIDNSLELTTQKGLIGIELAFYLYSPEEQEV